MHQACVFSRTVGHASDIEVTATFKVLADWWKSVEVIQDDARRQAPSDVAGVISQPQGRLHQGSRARAFECNSRRRRRGARFSAGLGAKGVCPGVAARCLFGPATR